MKILDPRLHEFLECAVIKRSPSLSLILAPVLCRAANSANHVAN
jgi:hypothetical protein